MTDVNDNVPRTPNSLEQPSTGNRLLLSSFTDRRLLPDVWRLIFQYVSSSRKDLANLTLTCASFRWFAQPLLFRRMVVQPFRTIINSEGRTNIAFTMDVVELELERLQFYSSSRISPSIKSSHVTPLQVWQLPITPAAPGPDVDRDIILDAFLQVLPVFRNLGELSFGEFDITAEQVGQLSRIESFKQIILCGCRLPAGDPPHRLLRIDHLSITATSATAGLTNEWLLATQLDVLKTLCLSEPYETFYFLTSPWPNSMQSLQSLEIPITSIPIHYLITAISKLPALEHLTLGRTACSKTAVPCKLDQPQTLHGSLYSYHGPLDIFMHFRLPRLRHLTISGLSVLSTASAEPHTLFCALSHLQEVIRQLEYLSFGIHYLTEALATTLFSLLPPQSSLQCFVLTIYHPQPHTIATPVLDSMQVSTATFRHVSFTPNGITHYL